MPRGWLSTKMPPQPLQVTDVLAQLPLDVVQQSFLKDLEGSDLQTLKLVSKAFAQLVRQHASRINLIGMDLKLEDMDSTLLSARVHNMDLYASARELYMEIDYSTDVSGLAVRGQEES